MYNLQAGKQCLCRFLLPCNLGRCQNVPNAEFTGSTSYDAKVIGVADAVDDRFNVIMNNGQVFLLSADKNINRVFDGTRFSFRNS